MLQDLPLEILAHIAEYISPRDVGEFGRTCQKCYFAVLPQVWHHLTLNNAFELNIVAQRLENNSEWAQRAIQFVRDVSLSEENVDPKISSTLAASMFGIASSPSQQAQDREELERQSTPQQNIDSFGGRLIRMFPHLSNLVFDFKKAVKDFYSATADTEETPRLPFSGSIALVNYKSDNAHFMHFLLAPFRRAHHLKVQAMPVYSLCDDIDESILTDADLADLSTLGLTHLRKLELSYLDSDIPLETFRRLISGMPHLNEIRLAWIFEPDSETYMKLCRVIDACAHLYPQKLQSKEGFLEVRFVSRE